MRSVPVAFLLDLGESMRHNRDIIGLMSNPNGPLPEDFRLKAKESFEKVPHERAKAVFPFTTKALAAITTALAEPTCTPRQINELFGDFTRRLRDETAGYLYLEIQQPTARHYLQPLHGWDRVVKVFPSTEPEIVEASRCFALARYTACVFHLIDRKSVV